MIFLASLLVALVLHILIGWPWSIAGGAVAGFASSRSGWLVGTVAVAMSWALLVLYNFATSPAEMGRFISITGALFGNLSGPMLVGVTVSIGALLGLLGGTIGGLTRRIVADVGSRRRP